jgi:hypothetical protein
VEKLHEGDDTGELVQQLLQIGGLSGDNGPRD